MGGGTTKTAETLDIKQREYSECSANGTAATDRYYVVQNYMRVHNCSYADACTQLHGVDPQMLTQMDASGISLAKPPG
jgi:hypothetical protein